MKKYINKEILKETIILTTILFFIEAIFRIFLAYPILDWSIVRIMLGLAILSLFINILLSFLKKNWIKRTVHIILILISTVYAIAQAGFQNYLGVFISLGASTQLGAVTDYIKDYFDSFNPLFYTMLIPLLIYIIHFVILKPIINKKTKKIEEVETEKPKKKLSKKEQQKLEQKLEEQQQKEKKIRWIQRGISTVFLFLFIGLYIVTLNLKFMQNDLQVIDNKSLFRNPSIPNVSVNQFGTAIFGLLDIKAFIFPVEENNFIEKEEPITEKEITDYTRYIDDTVWQSLINDSSNTKNQQILNDYFINRAINDENDYTGILKDKNLIVIMLESVNTIFINEEYFPNMYKLYNEGYSWDNAYSPRNSCSTGNNEMGGLISQFSIYRTCTYNLYKDNIYPQSIFNLFNNAGYSTTSYHNYTDMYYTRSEIHPNMYVNKFYGVNDLNIKYGSTYAEWPSDVELIDKSYPIFSASNNYDKYMAWITTVTSHQPYYASSVYGDAHYDLFKDLNVSKEIKRYLSKLKEVDLALGSLLANLKADVTLDDTVIVLYADHYPYGLSSSDISDYFGFDVTDGNEIDRTPFVIYNTELGRQKNEEYTSYINILPTLANLFGLDYDPRYYIGGDLLSDEYENRVIYADGSWEDPIAIYDAATSKITYKSSQEYTVDEIKKINLNITNRIKMSNLAIKENYFNYLYEGLEKHRDLLENQDNED